MIIPNILRRAYFLREFGLKFFGVLYNHLIRLLGLFWLSSFAVGILVPIFINSFVVEQGITVVRIGLYKRFKISDMLFTRIFFFFYFFMSCFMLNLLVIIKFLTWVILHNIIVELNFLIFIFVYNSIFFLSPRVFFLFIFNIIILSNDLLLIFNLSWILIFFVIRLILFIFSHICYLILLIINRILYFIIRCLILLLLWALWLVLVFILSIILSRRVLVIIFISIKIISLNWICYYFIFNNILIGFIGVIGIFLALVLDDRVSLLQLVIVLIILLGLFISCFFNILTLRIFIL